MFTRTHLVRSVQSALGALGLIVFPPPSSAHPMGNFSISHYADIRIEQGFIELRYLIDMAEIPTFQEMQQNNFDARADDQRAQAYLSKQGEVFKEGLLITLNGQPLPLHIASQDILFSPGSGNLPTMKFGLIYRAKVTDACILTRCELEYHDANFPSRVGWKEVITSAGHGVTIESRSVPSQDRSSQLSNYPTDLINSPPQDVGAKIVYSAEKTLGGMPSVIARTKNGTTPSLTAHQHAASANMMDKPAAASVPVTSQFAESSQALQLKPNQQGTPRSSFTQLVGTKEISLGIALLAALISAGLGALHALEPGHGKTIVAAYLVGSRGTGKHALLLGTIVTAAHTAGVYLLGFITIYAQKYILPERIYPFLGVLSGVLIAGMGCYLLLQRYLGAEFSHTHDYTAAAGGELARNPQTQRSRTVSVRQLVVLGITGGVIPCPAALVVLLSAVALHRTVFGLYLIVAFSLGLATVLIAMGMVTVYAGRLMSRLHLEGPFLQKWLPMGSAAMITFLGCGIALRGLTTAGLLHIRILG
ncbi:MAG TPA: sulfite exporter TauE/SafE family protein [Candidatus Acidoferrum sp.]